MEGSEAVSLCLPPLSQEDPLLSKKMKLLSARSLSLELRLGIRPSTEEVLVKLDQMVRAARILHLIEVELYFVGDDDEFGPFSTRNELESLNSVLSMIELSLWSAEGDRVEVLQVLKEATVDMICAIGADSIDYRISEEHNSDAEGLLLKWGENHGVRTKLKISHFEGAGRGALALEDIDIGETVFEIPVSLIICEELVYESEMFEILKKLDGISAETMLLLWSMKEKHNSSSKFKIYFDTLSKEFNTGLSFGIDALAALEGTLLFEEILQAREHLHNQYDTLCPALCTNYPNMFQPELYTWDQFLWACELWYSNSMKIVFTDGKLRTCLVPIAGLLNHSLCPHILCYGKVDSATNSLKLNTSRPCKGGEQCYLSYGSFPSSHLVTFYGFLPRGDNPYDVIPLDFDAPADDGSSQSPAGETGWTTHMVRGTWMSKSKKAPNYGLPSPLLDHLRSVLKDDDTEPAPEVASQIDINKDNERTVLETILSIFNPMMEGLGETGDLDRDSASWDVKLALDFKDLQRRIISSVLSSCSIGLRMLDSL